MAKKTTTKKAQKAPSQKAQSKKTTKEIKKAIPKKPTLLKKQLTQKQLDKLTYKNKEGDSDILRALVRVKKDNFLYAKVPANLVLENTIKDFMPEGKSSAVLYVGLSDLRVVAQEIVFDVTVKVFDKEKEKESTADDFMVIETELEDKSRPVHIKLFVDVTNDKQYIDHTVRAVVQKYDRAGTVNETISLDVQNWLRETDFKTIIELAKNQWVIEKKHKALWEKVLTKSCRCNDNVKEAFDPTDYYLFNDEVYSAIYFNIDDVMDWLELHFPSSDILRVLVDINKQNLATAMETE